MKKWGIIGGLCFIAAVVMAFFFNFENAVVVEIAVAAFGLASLIVAAVKDSKEKGVKGWKTALIICFAVIGGVLCCIGGLAQNIFAEVAGAVLAVLTVIFGLLFAKNSN